jgi:alkylation response protein AidB-like acyl-CoA dehydrogenase
MDFRDSADEAAFRAKLREWYAANFDAGQVPAAGRPEIDYLRAWSRSLYDAGYVGLTWPRDYGGRGLSPTYQAIYFEEMVRAGAPEHIGIIGLNMCGPTVVAHGTPEQHERYLARLLRADDVWCQLFSEPASGSDLAALRTTAVREGDEWVVNGQKVWSSWAHIADWCILVVRTDGDAEKHAGLSYLLVDMHAPGVEVRPLKQITGDPEFNEIFFTDVRVPRDSILGKPGDGWKVAMTTLLHERGTLAFALVAQLRQHFTKLVELAGRPGPDGRVPADDPVVRDAIAREWIELQGLAFTNYRTLTTLLTKGAPGPESSIVKLVWSEANQRLTKLARGLQGLSGMLDGEGGVEDGYWQYRQLRSRGNTIEAGTSEILRNIVAERVLSLPRSR